MATEAKKVRIPLLVDELTETERMNLTGMTQHPGFPALLKLFSAACERANKEVIALDQTEEGFERKFKPLQQRARDWNEFSKLILDSIDWHEMAHNYLQQERNQQQAAPENPILGKGLKNNV